MNNLRETSKIGKRELNKRHVRCEILNAAITVFQQKGYNETSIADIMKLADRGVGTFYNYFDSKDELLFGVLGSMGDMIAEAVTKGRAESQSILDILANASRITADFIDKNRYVLPVLTAATKQSGMPHDMPKENRESQMPNIKSVFTRLIAEGQQAGEIRGDVPIDIIAELFHSLFQAAAFSRLELSFKENVALKTKLILDGIKSNGR